MAKAFSMKDFYEVVGVKSGLSPKTTKRVWGRFIDLIISELQNNSYIQINGFGSFKSIRKGGTDEPWFNEELGIMTKRYVEPYDYVEFNPSKFFIEEVNAKCKRIYKPKFENDEELDEDSILLEQQKDPSLEEKMFQLLKNKKERKPKERARDALYQQGLNQGKGDKVKPKPLRVTDSKGNVKEYPSIYNCATQLGIRPIKLSQYLNKLNMECEGYTFEFVNEQDRKNIEERIRLEKEIENETETGTQDSN